MKITLLFITLFVFLSSFHNDNNPSIKDFRDVIWEMNIEEVIKAEYPNKYDEERKQSGELFYENIFIDNRIADLTYVFSGNKIKRVIVAYKFQTSSETKSLTNRVSLLSNSISKLYHEKYKKIECWHEFNGQTLTRFLSKPCDMTQPTLELVEQYATNHSLSHVCLTYTNSRTYVTVKYPSNKLASFGIYDRYIGWIEYSPN